MSERKIKHISLSDLLCSRGGATIELKLFGDGDHFELMAIEKSQQKSASGVPLFEYKFPMIGGTAKSVDQIARDLVQENPGTLYEPLEDRQ